MKYLLDTDHISFLQLRSGPEYTVLAARLAQQSPADFAFCIVSFHEQLLGANAFIQKAKNSVDTARGYALLNEILQGFSGAHVLLFNAGPAAVFDRLRAQGIRVATMDLRIASIALAQGLIVLTRNARDFRKVPGLVTDNWTV